MGEGVEGEGREAGRGRGIGGREKEQGGGEREWRKGRTRKEFTTTSSLHSCTRW